MNLSLETSVPALTVFLQGLLSFFSPCVLPLVPLYVGYLSGGTRKTDPSGNILYPRKTVLCNTLFFILGISFAFFLLGFGFTAIGRFFTSSRVWFARIGGVLIILFGLLQLGLFGGGAFSREHRLPFDLQNKVMNPLTALIFGFTFSFAWTPCVGPTLTSVLLMASSSASMAAGFLLIGIYTLGFVIPFLLVGLFTSTVLGFFKKHQGVVRVTVRAGGVLMILIGIMMLTGWMNGITGYLSQLGGSAPQPAATESAVSPPPASAEPDSQAKKTVPAPDFTLTDQFGKQHTLSDYRGKVVFLNFWASWCGPCKQEMPHIQAAYQDYGLNENDVVILGVANPRADDAPYNQDVTEAELRDFLAQGGYTYPTVMDTTGALFTQYGISAFPTTFMIDRAGNVYGYVPGSLTADMVRNIIEQTLAAG